MPKKPNSSANVDAIRHKDKRANIPTEELRGFVSDEELAAKTMLYPRDPSLDPQLVWKGKDEQDAEDLSVALVPIYIQEKVHPQAIIHNMVLEDSDQNAFEANQLDLFADFNGGPSDFDQKVEFYNHDQNWTNRMILGDSLLIMTSLSEKEGLKGKIQCIYLDPPYGIKFGSNWQVSTRKRDVKDGKAEDATRQPEQIQAFRDTWRLGVHSYLAYLRDRLVVARDLLTETGSIFLQIGEENVHLVRCLLDEVFGNKNFVKQITIGKTSGSSTDELASIADYLLWYSKDREAMKYRQLFLDKVDGEGADEYRYLLLPDGKSRTMTKEEISDASKIPKGAERYRPSALTSQRPMQGGDLKEFEFRGKSYSPGKGTFKTDLDGLRRLAWANRVIPRDQSISYLRKLNDFPVLPINNVWLDVRWGFDASEKRYVVETNSKVIQRCILMTTDPGDLVLDPTCGSGTSAYISEQWGRRWITCDTSRVALALARTRLMSARYPFYLLADSADGIKKEAEVMGVAPTHSGSEGDIRRGFVYKRVPHVTLKSIANNPDLKEGLSQKEIDLAISRHAETELLYDQPYENAKCIRVSGPFSVESLSPHRVLSTADENMDGTVSEQEARKRQNFAQMIIDNLKNAGVQNTRKSERLVLDRLDPYPGEWLNAVGEYVDSEGNVRRVVVSIGPEHGTVGADQIKEAAKEAVRGVGFDVLIVCGFAFDPHVQEETKRSGNLTVLQTKINPDLAMGDELLKKTGAGNLFMVFGEPDVELRFGANNKLTVEVKGVDVYDPTSGNIRSASTDGIACWFVDTNYNGESFFVRHAYFTGAEEPYAKLKRALRADIDETAWSSIYSTVSREFTLPKTGKIAVKVINHYGDEVLKVFSVSERVAVS